jgi:hypothetical protein
MKKLMYGALFLAAVGIGVVGCKKNEILQPNTTQTNISTDGKMLVFEDVESYEKAISDLTEEKKASLLKQVGALKFKNYFSVPHSKTEGDSIQEMDDFFGQLLNEDGAIQIGNHIYKVDLNSDQVYVLSVDDKDGNYNDLIQGNTGNKSVTAYSTGQDVLYLVNGEEEQKCGGIGGGEYPCYSNDKDAPIVYNVPNSNKVFRLNAKVTFFRAGIYFDLYSSYKMLEFSSSNAETPSNEIIYFQDYNMNVEIFCKGPQGWYQQRPCGSGDIGTRVSGLYYTRTENTTKKVSFYYGARNLNGYHFFVQSRVRFNNGTVTQASLYGGRNINSPY